jgi:hypothetical protein
MPLTPAPPELAAGYRRYLAPTRELIPEVCALDRVRSNRARGPRRGQSPRRPDRGVSGYVPPSSPRDRSARCSRSPRSRARRSPSTRCSASDRLGTPPSTLWESRPAHAGRHLAVPRRLLPILLCSSRGTRSQLRKRRVSRGKRDSAVGPGIVAPTGAETCSSSARCGEAVDGVEMPVAPQEGSPRLGTRGTEAASRRLGLGFA